MSVARSWCRAVVPVMALDVLGVTCPGSTADLTL